MANFSKEEVVQFENVLEGFSDALSISKTVTKYQTDQVQMARTGDTMWRPVPYILPSTTGTPGTDISAQFMTGMTQLSVPARINQSRVVPFILNQSELRDMLQENRLATAAKQRLASDIETNIRQLVSNQGAQVIRRTTPAVGYDDVALADSLFNEVGISDTDRVMLLSSRDYNNMASDLSKASRSFGNAKSDSAYERNSLGMVAGFETLKLGTAERLTAAAAGATTINGANQRLVPTNVDANGNNVDNRYQTITVNSTTSVKAGDAFTIAGVNRVHMVNKQDTGQLQTFRVVSVTNGTQMVITPAIVAVDGGSPTVAERQYQNVSATPANGAAITWLNTAAAYVNPFYHKSAVELLPGRYATPEGGVAVMKGTTDNGFEIVMTKQFNIDSYQTKYRFDVAYGSVLTNPSMAGIILFSQ